MSLTGIEKHFLLQDILKAAEHPAAFPEFYEPIDCTNGIVKVYASDWRMMIHECRELAHLLERWKRG